MSYGKTYFRHSVISVLTTGVIGVLFYVLRVTLYGHLSADDYGLFYALISVCMLLQPFLSLGFDPGIVPFVTRMREERNLAGVRILALNALACQVAVALAVAVPAMALARPVAVHVFGAPQAASLIRVLALFLIFLQPFKALMGVLLGLQFIGVRNLADLVRVICAVTVTLALLAAGWGAAAAAWGYAVSALVGAGFAGAGLLWYAPGLRKGPVFRWNGAFLAEVFRAGKHMAIAFGGITIFSYMDTVMLTVVGRDLRAVAAYQLAAPTLMLIYSLILAAASNFMPMVTTLWYREEKGLLADAIGRIYEAAVALLVPAGVIMACFSDVIIHALFRGPILNAPQAFDILAVGSVFFFVSYLNTHILCGLGLARAANGAVLSGLLLNFALNLALIPFFSIRGAAIATVVSYAACAVVGILYIRRALPVTLNYRVVMAVGVISTLIAFTGYYARLSPLFAAHELATTFAVGTASYLTALCAIEWLGFARLRELARVALAGRPR